MLGTLATPNPMPSSVGGFEVVDFCPQTHLLQAVVVFLPFRKFDFFVGNEHQGIGPGLGILCPSIFDFLGWGPHGIGDGFKLARDRQGIDLGSTDVQVSGQLPGLLPLGLQVCSAEKFGHPVSRPEGKTAEKRADETWF